MEIYGIDLDRYSKVIIDIGLNLQVGEELVISAPIESAPLVRQVTKYAYKKGAKLVTVFYSDDIVSRETFLNVETDIIADIPLHVKSGKDYIVQKKAVYLGILCDDPTVFDGVDPLKIVARQKAIVKACPEYRKSLDTNSTRWCLVAFPNKKWADLVFGNKEDSITMLGEKIATAMWIDKENYLELWQEHTQKLKERSQFLNNAKIKSFTYKNSIGTNFTIDMPQDYIFSGANEKGNLDGVDFVANMPTQEVFSSPDFRTANGTLVSSMPLVVNGVIVDNFKFEFKNGEMVSYSAEKGLETLESILSIDDGMKRLGEIALVDYSSPIRQSGVLFYETLFDENASCHFALGKSFSSCYKNGNNTSEEELLKVGLNKSDSHVDFMVGTKDLSIIATTFSGEKIEIFKNGKWTF